MSDFAFYHDMPASDAFTVIADADAFQPVPDDWCIFITDVIGSTRAIEAGRYKDVNLIGAASISTVLQTLGCDFPYSFGGDGATILIPESRSHEVGQALLNLAELSKNNFNLDLRVGSMTMAEIRAAGAELRLARHRLESGRSLALFAGSGLTLAEKYIKNKEEYLFKGNASPCSLDGLSCRWRPVPASRGQILAVLVQARADDSEGHSCYAEVIKTFDEILPGSITAANPIKLNEMSYFGVRDCIINERRFHSNRPTIAWCLRVLEIFGAVLMFKWKFCNFIPYIKHYANAMKLHTDYRKFDDMLRLVIDCSKADADKLEAWLEEQYQAERLYYGIHRSDQALMTCYVEGLQDSAHMHFVDADGGGYAMAATQLKKQLKA